MCWSSQGWAPSDGISDKAFASGEWQCAALPLSGHLFHSVSEATLRGAIPGEAIGQRSQGLGIRPEMSRKSMWV